MKSLVLREVVGRPLEFFEGDGNVTALMYFSGDWQSGVTYEINEVVINHSRPFVCLAATTQTEPIPGEAGPEWHQLSWSNVWRGIWSEGTYYLGDEVRHATGWLTIANKTTTDQPDPRPSEAATYDVPDAPTWTDQSDTAFIISGHTYTFTNAAISNRLEIWVPELSADISYQVLVTDITDPANPRGQFVSLPPLVPNEWNAVVVANAIIAPGTVRKVQIEAFNFGSSSQVTGGWNRGLDDNINNPAAQAWNKTNNDTLLRIDKTDLDSTDRSTELLGVIPGSTIQIAETADPLSSLSYTVTTTTDGGSSVNYGVNNTGTGPGGQPAVGVPCTITIDVPVPASTRYVELPGHWSGNQPTWATVEGYLTIGGVDQPAAVTSAFGIRLFASPAYLSPDWDIKAYTQT